MEHFLFWNTMRKFFHAILETMYRLKQAERVIWKWSGQEDLKAGKSELWLETNPVSSAPAPHNFSRLIFIGQNIR